MEKTSTFWKNSLDGMRSSKLKEAGVTIYQITMLIHYEGKAVRFSMAQWDSSMAFTVGFHIGIPRLGASGRKAMKTLRQFAHT